MCSANPVVPKSQTELPWRIGELGPKSKQLLLRFATTADIKQRNAAQKSKYYKKYSNPTAPAQVPRRRREGERNRLEQMEDDMEWEPETGAVLPIGGDRDLRYQWFIECFCMPALFSALGMLCLAYLAEYWLSMY